MAFQQPQRPRPARQFSVTAPVAQIVEAGPSLASPQRKRTLEDSQEWILFSPVAAPSTTRTRTTSTERTPRTAGLSRLSDFGSLETAARSDQYDNEDDNLTCQGTDPDDEGEELDSLDDGLHAFHEPSEYSGHSRRLMEQSGDTVLPTHDGLGLFPANTAAVQEQLWQFERHGSRRVRRRRRSSVQRRLDALEEAEEVDEQDERMQRIEKWRVEQSKALLEEIERETRRMRRMSRVSTGRSRMESLHPQVQDAASPKADPAITKAAETQTSDQVDSESFLQRFTRRVIRDLIGIDENLLSVIFGEALPDELALPSAASFESKASETSHRSDPNPTNQVGQSWEHRLLERIARELGILVHQLSEHPGAFSTYLRTQEPASYAGLPTSNVAIPDTMPNAASAPIYPSMSASGGLFAPTLQNQPAPSYSDASLWGIEEEPTAVTAATNATASYPQTNEPPIDADAAAREYWERELDVKMVFSFLVRRFSRPSSPSPNMPSTSRSLPTAPATTVSPMPATASTNPTISARRAALIKQTHPLAPRASEHAAAASRRRDLLHRHHYHHQQHAAAAAVLRSRLVGGGTSSCASRSTKKSRKSGSSRNYWDLGGSVGSGPAGGVGMWGEA